MSPDSSSTDGYHSVRKELQTRGYLEGPVERFVLHGSRVRGDLNSSLNAALRASLIASPILGALLLLAVSLQPPGIHRLTDYPLLWLYFSAFSGAAFFLIALLASRLEGAIGGGFRGATLRIALFVALPTLAYGWAIGIRSSGSADWPAQLAVLAAANVAALIAAWLSGLVNLARSVEQTGHAPSQKRKGWGVALAVLLPASALLVLLGRAAPSAGASLPGFEVQPRSGRVILIGLDGLDPARIAERASADPVWSQLYGEAQRIPLEREADLEPVEVWTTLATGVRATEHGVRGAGVERLPGVATPLDSASRSPGWSRALAFLLPTKTLPTTGRRRAYRTLWEILALKERSLSVGWWTSWPADQDRQTAARATVLSDRLLPKLLTGGEWDRETAPASLGAALRAQFPKDQARLREAFAETFEVVEAEIERVVWESFLIDAYRLLQFERLLADPGLKSGFLYLPGLDILTQRLKIVGASDPDRVSELWIETYRTWLVGAVGRLLTALQGEDHWFLVADTGREGDAGLILWRDPAQPSCVGAAQPLVALAPRVLIAAGFPIPEGSESLERVSCGGATSPVDRIGSYGLREVDSGLSGSSDDVEILERLRSLGYVK